MNAAVTLKALRLEAGLTQAKLADKAGLDRSWYNQLERGKKPLTRAPREKLAKALGVSPLELGGSEQEDPQAYRSLEDRLESVEAELDRRREVLEDFVEAATGRLAALEAALGIEAPRSTPQQQAKE